MRKLFLLIITFFCLLNSMNAQVNNTIPSLIQLEQLASTKSNVEFAKKIKSFGFQFKSKSEYNLGVEYIYDREGKKNGINYTETLIYRSVNMGNKLPQIILVCMTDLSKLYDLELKNKKYSTKDCENIKANEFSACYSNQKYSIEIIESRNENFNINTYKLLIGRTKP